MGKTITVDMDVTVLASHRMECTNYSFGSLQEGGVVVQAKNSEKVIRQVCVATEPLDPVSRESVKQFFSKESLAIGLLRSRYTGTCVAVAVDMLSDGGYYIRISHKEKQDEVYIAVPISSRGSTEKQMTRTQFDVHFLG